MLSAWKEILVYDGSTGICGCLCSTSGQRWHVSISFPNIFSLFADGSQRMVSFVTNLLSAGGNGDLAFAYASQCIAFTVSGSRLNFCSKYWNSIVFLHFQRHMFISSPVT